MALSELSETGVSIDAICLTETFIKSGSESNLHIKNFNVGAFFSRANERRGGTCILVKKGLSFKTLEIKNAKPYIFECCGLEILNYKLIIICVYRTPSSKVSEFLSELELLLQTLTRKSNKKVVLCGDWNIDVLKQNLKSNDLNALLNNHNLHNHILQPTRHNACLDLIVSNISIVKPNIHYLALSDHETGQSITVEVVKDPKIKLKPKFWFEMRRDFSKSNLKKFKNCLSALTFSDILSEQDLDTAFNAFHDLLVLFFELCFAKVRFKIQSKPLKNTFISKGIKRSCISKRKMYLKYLYSKSNKNLNKRNYHRYTQVLKKCLLQAQRLGATKYISKSVNVCSATWKVVKN